jgi:competence protein ComEC
VQLARVPGPLNPGEYDWAAAQRRDGRLTELYCDDPRCVAVLEPASWTSVDRALYAVRSWCAEQLAANVAPRDAPLVLATLLGDQELLSDSTKDAFLKTGSIHLLVISGAHVAMLAWIVWQLASVAGLAARTQLAATLGIVLLYAAIVGPEPSVVRATVVTATAVIALTAGRRASAGNLFGAAALVVMLINPSETFRSGTQFSFLAVAALILFAQWRPQRRPVDPLRRHLAETRAWWVRMLKRAGRWMLALAVASVAVGIAMAPLVAYHFHVVTPASVLLTPLASPLIGIAIGAGLATLTIGWLVPPIGALSGVVCGTALHWTEALVRWAQHIPYSYAYSCGPPVWWLVAFYGAIGVLAIVPPLRPPWRWQLAAGLAWAAVGYAAVGAGRTRPGELQCTFLAVGHGTCAVIELPSGQTVLYDAGSLGSPEMAHQIASSYLWWRGINRIDAIVLSHADIDHYNGVPGLLERFPVGIVYVSPMMFDPVATGGQLAAPNYLRDVLAASGVPLRQIWMSDRLRSLDPEVVMEVLHPPREGVMGRDNANSVLLSVEFAGRRILLPGDLESTGMEWVMADPPLDCDVLLAPHHGSAASDPPGFAAWCTPESVVFSGRRADEALPAMASYRRAGASVWHTAESGAVSCVISDQGVRISSYREGPPP